MSDSINSAAVAGLLPQRACQNCVRFKVKCVPQEGTAGTICQRCSRLRRACFTSTPTIRQRRRNKGSKVAQLESRINELSTLIGSANSVSSNTTHDLLFNQPAQNPSTLQPNTGQDESRRTYFTPQSLNQDPCIPADLASRLRSAYRLTSPPLTDDDPSALLVREDNPDVFQDYPAKNDGVDNSQSNDTYTPQYSIPTTEPSSNSASLKSIEFCPIFLDPKLEYTLFKDFCTNMSPFFPFVVIDASISTETMKKERPFLFWACITAASYHQHQLHKRLVEEMLKGIGEYAFAKCVKNLDLLQAILVMAVWYHFYAHIAPQLVNLLQLGNAMTMDLGINRPPRLSGGRLRAIMELSDSQHGRPVLTHGRTSDECRALLGCYFLLSKSSMCHITTLEPIRYTKYMHECCRILENLVEFETDVYLVQLIELHRITGKYTSDELATSNMPMGVCSNMFMDELQRFQYKLPAKLGNSPIFRAEIGYCKVYVHGPSRLGRFDDSMGNLQSLHLCVTGLTECLADLGKVTTEQFSRATFSTWICMMECLMTNARLCFLKVDGWDLNYARRKLNFTSLVQQIIDIFEAIRKHNSITKPETAAWKFSLYAERLRKCKSWYEAKIALEKRSDTACDQTGNSEGFDGSFDPSSFRFDSSFDDMIWGDIIGSWTYF